MRKEIERSDFEIDKSWIMDMRLSDLDVVKIVLVLRHPIYGEFRIGCHERRNDFDGPYFTPREVKAWWESGLPLKEFTGTIGLKRKHLLFREAEFVKFGRLKTEDGMSGWNTRKKAEKSKKREFVQKELLP